MNFDLTDEQRMVRDGLRRLLSEGGGWDPLTEMGVPAMLLTEAQGGYGGTGADLMVVFEEMGRAGSDLPLIDTGVLGAGLLAACGRDAPTDGTRIALAHQEHGTRYELARVETRAEGDRLTGRKSLVHDAPDAARLLVTARTHGPPADPSGIALYEIDPKDVDLQPYPLAGGGQAAEATLDATPGTLLHDDAHDILVQAHARATLALCAEALGLMEAIQALTIDYLKTRRQFGRPLAAFQALQHRVADLAIEVEQARSAVINLAGHVDGPDRDRHVAATKLLVGDTARLVVEEAIQMHGGIGVTDEYDLAHLARRLTSVDHRFGDTIHHLERFIEVAL